MKSEKRKLKILSMPIIALAIIVILSAVSAVYKSSLNTISSIVISGCDVLVAAVAGFLIVHQLSNESKASFEQNKIRQADFILEYNRLFLDNTQMNMIERYFEAEFLGKKTIDLNVEDVASEHRQMLIEYLVYLEGFASCVLGGLMTFEEIDNLFAYRFFLAMNHPDAQRLELLRFPQYYRGCYMLYEKWFHYRKNKWKYDVGYGIPLIKNDIRRTGIYRSIVNKYSLRHKKNYTKVYDSKSKKVAVFNTDMEGMNWNFENVNIENRNQIMREVYKSRIKYVQLTKDDLSWLTDKNLEDIAELIYNTDSYIYPALFETVKNAKVIIPQLFKSNTDKMFSLSNIFAGFVDNHVVMITLWKDGKLNWNLDSIIACSRECKIALPKSISLVKKNYVEKMYSQNDVGRIEIINVSTQKEFAGFGLTYMMLCMFINNHLNHSISLCVLKDNTRAVELYERLGFYIEEEYNGFSIGNKAPKCYVMARVS